MTEDVDGIREYMRDRRSQNARKKNLTEEMGQTKADFCEKQELNKTAVAFAERLDRLSAEKRDDVMKSLGVLFEALQPVWSQESTKEMDFDGSGGGKDEDEDEEKEETGVAAAQQFERERNPSFAERMAAAKAAKAAAGMN